MIALIWALAAILLTTNSRSFAQTQDVSEFNYTVQDGYPIGSKLFGNLAGIDVDKDSNIVIFHRGSHVWNAVTFDANDVYLPDKDSPIKEHTVVTIDPIRNKVVSAWGGDRFFMPHGLSLDLEGKHLWLTDVALHQVFKFTYSGKKEEQEVLTLGTAFVPGNDESHFCKPTSVADTGEFVFVADGYCNSRVVMFSAQGRYLGEFGQSSDAAYLAKSSRQPTFNIPHKIIYAKEANMICVADRENGRIQCFSFEPKRNQGRTNQDDTGVILSGAIELKFTIADPLFNGRLFSIDYSPYGGGIIAAVSGESFYSRKPPLGFVYNATTLQLISKFAPKDVTFGMAHDVAFTGNEANSIYVVDTAPINLWKFSRPVPSHKISRAIEMASRKFNEAVSLVREKERGLGLVGYLFLLSLLALVVVLVARARRSVRYSGSNSFTALYSSAYPASVHSLFGNNRYPRRPLLNGSGGLLSTVFSRRAFFNLFDRGQQQPNDFSRVPLEESDNSDNYKSDSDVEEFNINEASANVKIDV